MAAIINKMEWVNLRAIFYLVTPNETSFEHLSQVPDYMENSVPFFAILMVLEAVILKFQGEELRLNDSINSISHALLTLLPSLIIRPVELVTYVWLYDNYRLVDLPWDSPWVWFLAILAMDFTYYWFHRASHEVNFIWAAHQVHHSSEQFNLTTAFRQSAFQKYYNMVLNFGMAFFLPPQVFYVHLQLNLMYQVWIHTEVIRSLGPLEYVLNTPSHHRVHHGRNPYYIDRNYGGILIIWDRIFNTFEAEDEKAAYGLVQNFDLWNPFYGQIQHYLKIIGLVWTYDTFHHKMSAIFKGPGWEPGKPRISHPSDIPEIEGKQPRYDSDLPFWASVYVTFHFVFVLAGYVLIAPLKDELSALYALACIVFFIMSVTSFGALFDHSKYAAMCECFRCMLFLAYYCYIRGPGNLLQLDFLSGLSIVYAASAVLWFGLTCLQYRFQVTAKKSE